MNGETLLPLRRLGVALVFGSAAASCAVMPLHSGGAPVPPAGQQASAPAPRSSANTLDPAFVPRLDSGWILALACLDEPEIWTAAKQLDAARAILIGQYDGETNGVYDEAKLRRMVAQRIPAGWRGLAQLDFEGRWLQYLNAPVDSAAFRDGEAAMLRLLEVAREVRPEARWTFYGVPYVPYWLEVPNDRSTNWLDATPAARELYLSKARRAKGIIDACDWVAPVAYSPYLPNPGNPKGMATMAAYVRAKTGIAVELAGGKPVLAMTWHRVHDSNKADGSKLLTADEMLEGQIKPAIEGGAVGVVWWGSDGMLIRTVGRDVPRPPDVPRSAYKDADAMRKWAVRETLRRMNELAAGMRQIPKPRS